MLYDIFTHCSISDTPQPIGVLTEKEFVNKHPIARGSRSGDGEYGLVSMLGQGFLGGRGDVYVRLTKENVPRLRQLNLNF